MPTYLTPNRHGYSVRFSPFQPDKIVCATSQYFGLAGGGTLFVLEVTPDGTLIEISTSQWPDGLFDVVWSETDANIVVTASGDGILQIWNIACPQLPPQTLREHKKEVYSVDWSQTRQEQLVLSASWDCSVKLNFKMSMFGMWKVYEKRKDIFIDNLSNSLHYQPIKAEEIIIGDINLNILKDEQNLLGIINDYLPSCDLESSSLNKWFHKWDPNRSVSLATFLGHSQLVYNAMWSPHVPSCFASVSGDGTLRIWNSLVSQRATMTLKAHEAEVLSCSWCKFDQNILATGGSDGLIRGWDLRNFSLPIFEQKGCEYAVRRIQFSPHNLSIMASVSYDFTTRIWDFKVSSDAIETIRHHSEFVYGLDFNNHIQGQIADCGWDSLVHVFNPRSLANLCK